MVGCLCDKTQATPFLAGEPLECVSLPVYPQPETPGEVQSQLKALKSYCFSLGLAALLHFITTWPGVLTRRYFETINTGLKFHLLFLPSMGDFCPIPLSQWLDDFFYSILLCFTINLRRHSKSQGLSRPVRKTARANQYNGSSRRHGNGGGQKAGHREARSGRPSWRGWCLK